ncbi:hypothetical protein NL676_027191 [Syzygium grande]|nr:hypothetical protein NL676_027191 [Syzygium grande]
MKVPVLGHSPAIFPVEIVALSMMEVEISRDVGDQAEVNPKVPESTKGYGEVGGTTTEKERLATMKVVMLGVWQTGGGEVGRGRGAAAGGQPWVGSTGASGHAGGRATGGVDGEKVGTMWELRLAAMKAAVLGFWMGGGEVGAASGYYRWPSRGGVNGDKVGAVWGVAVKRSSHDGGVAGLAIREAEQAMMAAWPGLANWEAVLWPTRQQPCKEIMTR